MASGVFGSLKGISRFGLWALCYVIMFLMFGVIAEAVLSFTHVDLHKVLTQGLFDKGAVWGFRFYLFLNQLSFIAAGVFFFQLVFGRDLKEFFSPSSLLSDQKKRISLIPEFEWNWKVVFSLIGLTFVLIVISGYLRIGTEYLLDYFQEGNVLDRADKGYEKSLRLMGVFEPGELVFNLFFLALIPAVCEEYFFRKVLIEGVFDGWMNKKWLIALVVGLIFSLFHFEFSGFLVRWMMGFVFTYVYLEYRNYYYTTLMHFLYNAVGLIGVVFSENG